MSGIVITLPPMLSFKLFTLQSFPHKPLDQLELNLVEMLLGWSSILYMIFFSILKLNIAARVNYSLYMLKFQNVLSPEITNM